MKILYLIFLLIFSPALFAENTILIVGDSISAGYGFDTSKGWTALLAKKLNDEKYNYTVANASLSGDTLSNGITRLPALLKQYHPTLTIIELGGNDGLRSTSLAVIQKNLDAMIQLALDEHSKVLVLGVRIPPMLGVSYANAFEDIFTTLSKRSDISVVPLFLNNIDNDPSRMQADHIHPSQESQPLLLDNIWDTLKKML